MRFEHRPLLAKIDPFSSSIIVFDSPSLPFLSLSLW